MTKAKPMSPQMRRLHNLAAFWDAKFKACTTDAALARVCFDRARAAARRAQDRGESSAMHDLAALLAEWAQRLEDAERRHAA
ncbi:hypothetical protein [Actinocorallia libanotica]|uniref:Uncharacterized protein n=1 Tax=Actinocorallia libanotica TaxID=46162 RepID=A0ABP4CQE6_9ACTN